MILTLFCGIAMYFVKFHIIPIVQQELHHFIVISSLALILIHIDVDLNALIFWAP